MIRSAVDFAQIQQAEVRSRHRAMHRLFVAALTFLLVFTGRLPTPTLASGDPPTAVDQTELTRESTPVSFFLNATDNEFDDLSFTVLSGPASGAVDECEFAFCTYTPDPDFIGTDAFTWRVNDGTSDSDTATATITVTANAAPVASDQPESTREGKALLIFLQAADADFDDLSYTVVDTPGDGTLDPIDCAGGSCTYTPNTGFIGIDTFTWKANDGLADSNTATATIDVNPNTEPIAFDDFAGTREAKPVQLFLFANDDDLDELTYTIVSEPNHGNLACIDGTCTYSPNTAPNYIGDDSFTWKANDGLADSNIATFSIEVVANTGPEAFDQSELVRENTDEAIFLVTHDEDFDELSHVIVDPPDHGTLSDCSSGSCVYSPAAAYVGPDSFTWKANDGLADSNIATFSIEVVANTAPVALDGSVFVFTDTSAPATMAATDNEDDPLSYTIVSGPEHGDLTDCFGASCIYTPDLGYAGPDSFTWTADDGQVDSNVATMQITVGEPIGRVLILESTVTNGADSREAQAAAIEGYAADVVDETTWGAMTAAEFDSYAAIVLGDPTCASIDAVAAAEANRATWSSVVDGNVVVVGTDPIFHEDQGGGQLTDSAMAYVLASTDKTGLFAGLSCYYDGAEDNTPVPLLDAFGTFEVGHADCFNDAHIVAEHPALAGLDDGDLSEWSCSVHEVFQDWPLSFVVLTIAENFGSVYTATDGTVGSPYILAAGDIDVASDIDLTPLTATNSVGTSHEVTASVSDDSGPIVGTTVTFTVINGPHSATTGSDTTDSAGEATFTYVGTTAGSDTIKATFVDAEDRTQTSNLVTKTWEPTPTFDLDVTLAGDGSGSVSSDPAGIDCPDDCAETYADGTLVTLSADPGVGSTFAGWTGDCTGSDSCVLTMDAARGVTATFDPPPSADLSVTKTDEPDPVTAGNAIHYVLTVTNSGPDTATGIVVEDTLPTGTSFIEADAGCVHLNGVVTCPIASLSSGGSVETSIVVRAPNVRTETVITNSVTVSGAQDDPNPLNDARTEDTTVQPAADDPDMASGWITGVGGTVATNAAKPPTKKDPMTTSVTVPPGFPGMVTITEGPIIGCPAVRCFGQEAEITAPTTTAEEPLRLVFSYHPGSLPPGTQLHEITMFHDGVAVDRCDDDSGSAEPDPCTLSVTRNKGAVTVTVLSSENGSWVGGR